MARSGPLRVWDLTRLRGSVAFTVQSSYEGCGPRVVLALFAAKCANPMKTLLSSAFFALLVTGASPLTAAGADNGGVALPEEVMPELRPLVEQAMRQSPRMLERNLDLAQSEADGYMARASSLPSAGGYATFQQQREKRLDRGGQTSNNEKTYYNFAINQAVWHWGALEATRKIARINQELALINYGQAYRALAGDIRSSYLGLVLAKIGLRNAEHLQRLAEENLKRQQARYNANQITYGQIMQDQLRVDETSLAARRARVDLEFSLATFRALTGDAQFGEDAIPDAIADVPQAPAVASVVASSVLESHDSILSAEKEVAKAKLGRVGPRFNLYPKFSLVAGVTRDEITRDIVLNTKYQVDTWYAGAQVNWTVFDGFSTKGQKLAALTRLRRAESRLASLRESLGRTLDRERLNVGFTWDAYQMAKIRLRMAREGLDSVCDKLKRGEASQEQVDQAQSNLNSQLYAAQLALANHLNANVQYLSSQGMDPLAKPAVLR